MITKIFVCCHNKVETIPDGSYVPLQVGKAISSLDLGIMSDDSGDNISAKNKSYSELTGMYWIWKNVKDSEVVGLCHYRRFFDMDLSAEKLERILRQKEAIVITPNVNSYSVELDFSRYIGPEDLYIFLDTLLEFHPEYRDAVRYYVFKGNKVIPCNMIVAPKTVFDSYCEFAFPILFETEKRVGTHPYSRQNRNIGYMGELLLGIYFFQRKSAYYSEMLTYPLSRHSRSLVHFINRTFNGMRTLGYRIGKIGVTHSKELKSCLNYTIVNGLKNDGITLKSLLNQ